MSGKIDFILMSLLTQFHRKWSGVHLPLCILVKILHITHISTKGSSMIKLLRLPLTVLTFFGLISAVSADLDSGLVRYMKFEEGSGDSTYDSSGYGDHGTCSMRYYPSFNPWTTAGYSGGGMHFKGGNGEVCDSTGCYQDAIVIGDIPSLKYTTISVWVKPDSGTYGCIVHGPGNLMLIDSSSTPYWGVPNGMLLWGHRVVKVNEWNHIVVAISRDTSWMYINGRCDTMVVHSPDSITSDTGRIPFQIGGWAPLAENFKGSIDEVRIYNRALSGSEVLELACTNRIYVDSAATGNNNGTSWANAYTNLKMALDSAPEQTTICVSKGTYFPTNTTDRAISFQMKSKTCLYGGFNSSTGDTTILTRDWINNPTILNGDIGTRGDSTDNSYHVVKGANDATLDGFIIEKGNSDSIQTTFYYGGGMANISVSPNILNCTFQNNHGVHGGAMVNVSGASPFIKNCKFLNNSVVWYGAGVLNIYSCKPYFLDCSFIGNHNDSVSSGNTRNGGALYVRDTSNVTLVNCNFIKNKMRGYGGGVFVQRYSNVNFYNCSFYRNIGMWYDRGGGAISVYGDSSTVEINNCILWKDSSALSGEIYIRPNTGSSAKIRSSNIEGGWNGPKVYTSADVQNLGGNINSDPLFNNPDSLDLSLNSSSPCIDSGDNSSVQTEKDINGNSRIIDGNNDQTATVDMGPYEFQP
jgi:hypothetical protein